MCSCFRQVRDCCEISLATIKVSELTDNCFYEQDFLSPYLCFLDLIKSGITAASGGPTGTLMQDLKNANSPNTVLNIVGTHHKSMNSEHIIQALRSIFSIQKFGKYVPFIILILEVVLLYL